MIRRHVLPAIALLAGLTVGACAAPAASEPTLEGRDWTAIQLNGKPIRLIENQSPPSLTFDATSGRVTGSTGCNSLSGSYRVQGDTITIEKVATTRRACMNGMDTEQPFLAALNQARQWKIAGGLLTLSDGAGQALAVLKP
ncbi:MAG: META domain-containing protein [Ferrovibrionaceae bacterium]